MNLSKFWTIVIETTPLSKDQGFAIKNHLRSVLLVHPQKPTLTEIEQAIRSDDLDRLVQVTIREASDAEVGKAVLKDGDVVDLENNAIGPLKFTVNRVTPVTA